MKRIACFYLILATLSLFPFAAVSCKTDGPAGSILLQKEVVGKSAGRIFINITSEGGWQLGCDFHGEEEWVRFSKTSGTGSTGSVIMKYDENLSPESRSATVTATFSDGSSSSMEFFQSGSVSGGEGTLLPQWDETPGLKSDVAMGWMELPSMYPPDGETEDVRGCAWVYHNMAVNSKSVRNYSIFYDALNLMPRWVAYPLNKGLIGSGNRTNDWKQTDPKIPVEYQPYTAEGWGQSGFDRGHMLPSADRLREQANRATFYPTNMTMQDSNLNQNVWAALEGQTRIWADLCDTLYVVTGAVPSSKFRNDRKGNRVNVPKAYYKALLSYDRNRSPEYIGVAFWFENSTYSGDDYNTHKMTIRELEDRVNMNFFVNLAPKYENAETEISPKWGLK